mmetsp:Transcript_34995/g.35637  ORF Transcript_34995/g.35637 Transcript_34995/m.35637 type:complete len:103 (+) Transcript_34995:583-891(+)
MIIPKGTLTTSLLSVRLSSKLMEREREKREREGEKEQYQLAYQDFMSWYIEVPGGTLVTVMTRVDLGPDIPHWAFLTLITATAIRSVNSLIKYVKSFENTKN